MIYRRRLIFYPAIILICVYIFLDSRLYVSNKGARQTEKQKAVGQALEDDTAILDPLDFKLDTEGLAQDGVTNLHDLSNYSLSVTQDMIESFRAALPPTLRNYKNPCWYERVPTAFTYVPFGKNDDFVAMSDVIRRRCSDLGRDSSVMRQLGCWRLRCFPYFFLLGVEKCATTDIYYLLTTFHPNVVTDVFKEPYYWGFQRRQGATFAQYLDLFDYPAEAVRSTTTVINGIVQHPMIIGDFSPNTGGCLPRWSQWLGNMNQLEPRITNAHLIRHIRPQTKLVMSIRNPVNRFISNFFYTTNRRYLPMTALYDFCKKIISGFQKCSTRHPIRHCVYSSDSKLLTEGIYYVMITDWLDVFPSQQLFVLRFEDYVTDRVLALNQIAHFLDIGEIPVQHWSNITKDGAQNANPDMASKEPVPRAVTDMLTDFYRPWENRLDQVLKNDKRLWNKH